MSSCTMANIVGKRADADGKYRRCLNVMMPSVIAHGAVFAPEMIWSQSTTSAGFVELAARSSWSQLKTAW